MSKKELIAFVAMMVGFVSLVSGVAMLNVPAAAMVGGVILIAFGLALDRHAVQ